MFDALNEIRKVFSERTLVHNGPGDPLSNLNPGSGGKVPACATCAGPHVRQKFH